MNQTNIAILVGVFVRIAFTFAAGWLAAHGVSAGDAEAAVAAIISVLVPIVWGYLSRLSLLNQEPPK